METLVKTNFSRGLASQMRATSSTPAQVSEFLESDDISPRLVFDYTNGLAVVASEHKEMLARALDRSVDYLEELGGLAARLENGNRDSVLFAAGVMFSARGRSWDSAQLTRNILDRGGLSLRDTKAIVHRLKSGDRTDEYERASVARAFGVPAQNIILIGQKILEGN